ncbi:MAG: hypothetical protein KDN22_24125 [Verrucomicrobiae bacterium]|nr:hypothetical protein [Verrucomicrobiae bacterium]
MNETGLVAFAGLVSDASDPANNGRGLFIADSASSVAAAVREGQAVSGGDTLAAFGRPSLNEVGDVAFYALFTDDPEGTLARENVGLYRQTATGLIEIAREGQAAPNGDGQFDLPQFLTSTTPNFSLRPMFNDIGQVAFLANLVETVASSTNDKAIYLFLRRRVA